MMATEQPSFGFPSTMGHLWMLPGLMAAGCLVLVALDPRPLTMALFIPGAILLGAVTVRVRTNRIDLTGSILVKRVGRRVWRVDLAAMTQVEVVRQANARMVRVCDSSGSELELLLGGYERERELIDAIRAHVLSLGISVDAGTKRLLHDRGTQ